MRNELITFTDPKSPISEMFKTLRTNIQFMSNSKKLQTILVTSTLPGEGKSWTSANLAVTFAQAGKEVLIIDSDMRKGRQFSIFNVTARPGLSNYLSGVVNEGEVQNPNDVKSFIRKTEIENLYVIPAGDVPPNPSELLISSRMNQLLLDIREYFDFIIFDAPPSLLVTDATILARMLDTTIIVAAHQETKTDDLNKVQKAIKNVGGNIAGVVINKMPISAKKYEYMGYYGNSQDILKVKESSPDLYLRGKATILDDRHKSKEISRNVENETKEEKEVTQPTSQPTSQPTPQPTLQTTYQPTFQTPSQPIYQQNPQSTYTTISETEELLKKMNAQIEEQKRQMNNQ